MLALTKQGAEPAIGQKWRIFNERTDEEASKPSNRSSHASCVACNKSIAEK